TEAADRRVATFSGGMRRRLDIAMSLVGQPSVIFLDEPTTGLDPQSRNELWETIRGLARGGTTVFLTTQYLEEADQLADHIAVLHQGKIAASGTAGDLKRLVPSGLVDLVFNTQDELTHARLVLEPQHRVTERDNLTLSIDTDGTVADIARLFIHLRDAGVEPSSFEQKLPTLDDVFFKIIASEPLEA
ncbi:MAG TPA: AAA family ATPase, partial [Thermomicrobiaceae bacterium]|nr:AAA family ATPase [Thermomicrobiaceae bacterium]